MSYAILTVVIAMLLTTTHTIKAGLAARAANQQLFATYEQNRLTPNHPRGRA